MSRPRIGLRFRPSLMRPLTDTVPDIRNRLIGQGGSRNSKFQVNYRTFMGNRFTKKFTNVGHYENWLMDLSRNNFVDSEGIDLQDADSVLDNVQIESVQVLPPDFVGGCNKHHSKSRLLKGKYYHFECHSPVVKDNNCLLSCLNMIFNLNTRNFKKIREHINVSERSMLSEQQMPQILEYYHENYDIKPVKINILDLNTPSVPTFGENIICSKDHFYLVTEITDLCFNKFNIQGKKRWLLTWDIETRDTKEYCYIPGVNLEKDGSQQKCYFQKATILNYTYQSRSGLIKGNITTKDKSCLLQFLEWLKKMAMENIFFACYAHYGSGFDHFFLLEAMSTYDTKLLSDPILRGRHLIELKWLGHRFNDSWCFIPDSLDNICNSFKIEQAKQTEIVVHGKKITNLNLCLYRPELGFDDFMNLQFNDREFWDKYTTYCQYDCDSLMEIVSKFDNRVQKIAQTISKDLVQEAKISRNRTIAGLAKNIFIFGTRYRSSITNQRLKMVRQFIDNDLDKYLFLRKFITGGISYFKGVIKTDLPITTADISSQYPSALLECMMYYGYSKWYEGPFRHDYGGYWHLKNLKFNQEGLKPIPEKIKGQSLKWFTDEFIQEAYLDTSTIFELQENFGLKSFEVENALVGIIKNNAMNGYEVFGPIVDILYEQKKNQDSLRDQGNPDFDAVWRETVKLILNSFTGKLVENTLKYNNLINQRVEVDESCENKNINGISFMSDKGKQEINNDLPFGLQVYAKSKLDIFKYISFLPNSNEDVLKIETDSISFLDRHREHFIQGVKTYTGKNERFNDYKIAVGGELGNIKLEKTTTGSSIIGGKKINYLDVGEKTRPVCKGFSRYLVQPDGTKVDVLTKELYEYLYIEGNTRKIIYTKFKKIMGPHSGICRYNLERTLQFYGKRMILT